uniref:Uncharacterized protein n=1 Tax=Sphaeramia orbicularis TaxID=375764 RepID=A0A673A3F4_9TELE
MLSFIFWRNTGSISEYRYYNVSQVNVYGLTRPEIGNSPLFDFHVCSSPPLRKEDVMSATLDVYMRIFTSILHEKTKTSALLGQMSSTDEEKVEKDLKELHQKMKDLKRHLSHMIQNKKDVLNKLSTIKVDPFLFFVYFMNTQSNLTIILGQCAELRPRCVKN